MKERVHQIDLFRFIAALSVVLYHYLFRGYAADDRTTLNMVEAGAYFRYGYLGVHWFFIISGFVIPLSIKNQSLKGFLTARFIRLYPAYWFAVIATFATVTLFGAPRFAATVKQELSTFQCFRAS